MSAVVLLQRTLTCKITAAALCYQSMSSVLLSGSHIHHYWQTLAELCHLDHTHNLVTIIL